MFSFLVVFFRFKINSKLIRYVCNFKITSCNPLKKVIKTCLEFFSDFSLFIKSLFGYFPNTV